MVSEQFYPSRNFRSHSLLATHNFTKRQKPKAVSGESIKHGIQTRRYLHRNLIVIIFVGVDGSRCARNRVDQSYLHQYHTLTQHSQVILLDSSMQV